MAWTFLKVSAKVGLDRRTGLLYWKTLLRVLVRNPRATAAVVSMAALYVHYAKVSEFVIYTLEDKIAHIESCGEETYNEWMIKAPHTGERAEQRSGVRELARTPAEVSRTLFAPGLRHEEA